MIDGPMWAGIACSGVVMALLSLLTLDLFLPGGLIEGHEGLALARTAGFTVLVLAQLFNCFNARSETRSAWQGLFSNRWLWATVLLSPVQWGQCLGMASGVRCRTDRPDASAYNGAGRTHPPSPAG